MISKTDLLARTHSSWEALNAFVATLDDRQRTQLTDAAGWTVKDHLIHLAVWEDGVWAMLNRRDRAAHMGIPAEVWARWDFDEINAVIQARHRERSWGEVDTERRVIHARFVAQITALSEADLLRPVRDFQPHSQSNSPIYETIIGDAYDHYDSHAGWIKAIVEGVG